MKMRLIEKEMKLKGFTASGLAKVLGISKVSVYHWMKGTFLPTPGNVIRLKELGFSDTACLEPSKKVML